MLLPILRTCYKHLVAIALPPTCFGCDVLLGPGEPVGLCPKCWAKVPRWDRQEHPNPPLPKAVDHFDAPFVYQSLAAEWIPALKFGDKTELAVPLARHMVPLLPEEMDVIVPVPIHPKRLRRRMYNQSAELARAMGCLAQKPVDVQQVRRVKNTPPQVGKSAVARRKMSVNTFEVEEGAFAGKVVVLVDDVWTTGSTMGACAAALKKAGAKKVYGVALAYVPPGVSD